jgi:hypothetical protein
VPRILVPRFFSLAFGLRKMGEWDALLLAQSWFLEAFLTSGKVCFHLCFTPESWTQLCSSAERWYTLLTLARAGGSLGASIVVWFTAVVRFTYRNRITSVVSRAPWAWLRRMYIFLDFKKYIFDTWKTRLFNLSCSRESSLLLCEAIKTFKKGPLVYK